MAEEWDRVFGSGAHADEFDFRHDEAVAAGVFAHVAVELGEGGQVEDFALADFVSHACVPAVEGFDESDYAAATVAGECALGVVLVVGEEVGPVFASLCAHADVVVLALADFERRVDFGGVEVPVDGSQFGFRVRLQPRLRNVRHRERAGADVDAEELVEIGNRFDRFQIEAVPHFEVPDIPPRMHLLPASEDHIGLVGNQIHRRVRPGEVFGQVDRGVILRHELEFLCKILRLDGRAHRRRHERRSPWHHRRSVVGRSGNVLGKASVSGVAVMPEGKIIHHGSRSRPAVTRPSSMGGGEGDGGV